MRVYLTHRIINQSSVFPLTYVFLFCEAVPVVLRKLDVEEEVEEEEEEEVEEEEEEEQRWKSLKSQVTTKIRDLA